MTVVETLGRERLPRPRPHRTFAAGAVGLLLAAWCVPVAGQAVRGRVFDAGTRRPLANTMVRLVDESGEGRTAAAADDAGRFRVEAPEPGTYRVRAEQLGYETSESESFVVSADEDVSGIDIAMSASPIPIRGVDVSADAVNRRLTRFLGSNPALLRVKPIQSATIRRHAERGDDVSEMMTWQRVPNLDVMRTREGPCYQFRRRGCLPVYLDGARISASSVRTVPLEMLGTVVVLLPNELVAYPNGAVHLLSAGFVR